MLRRRGCGDERDCSRVVHAAHVARNTGDVPRSNRRIQDILQARKGKEPGSKGG